MNGTDRASQYLYHHYHQQARQYHHHHHHHQYQPHHNHSHHPLPSLAAAGSFPFGFDVDSLPTGGGGGGCGGRSLDAGSRLFAAPPPVSVAAAAVATVAECRYDFERYPSTDGGPPPGYGGGGSAPASVPAACLGFRTRPSGVDAARFAAAPPPPPDVTSQKAASPADRATKGAARPTPVGDATENGPASNCAAAVGNPVTSPRSDDVYSLSSRHHSQASGDDRTDDVVKSEDRTSRDRHGVHDDRKIRTSDGCAELKHDAQVSELCQISCSSFHDIYTVHETEKGTNFSYIIKSFHTQCNLTKSSTLAVNELNK